MGYTQYDVPTPNATVFTVKGIISALFQENMSLGFSVRYEAYRSAIILMLEF